MPVARPEVIAQFTVLPAPLGEDEPHVKAAMDAARSSGLLMELGPDASGLAGDRSDVLAALSRVIDAALGAGARAVELTIEAQEVAG